MENTVLLTRYLFDLEKNELTKTTKEVFPGPFRGCEDPNYVCYYKDEIDRDEEYCPICDNEELDIVQELFDYMYVMYSFNDNLDYNAVIKEYFEEQRTIVLSRLNKKEKRLLKL